MSLHVPPKFLPFALLIAVTLFAFCFPSQTLNYGLGIGWAVMMLIAGCAVIGGAGPRRSKYVGFLIASGVIAYWELGSAAPKSYTAPVLALAEQVMPPNELYEDNNTSIIPSRFYPDGFSGATFNSETFWGRPVIIGGIHSVQGRQAHLTPLAKSIRLLSLFWFGLLGALLCHYIASRTTPETEEGVG